MQQSFFLINDVYHLELSGALELLLTVLLNPNWLDIDHMLRKITRTFQLSIKAGNFAHVIRDLLKMS